MLQILFVFRANVFEKLSVGQQFVRHRDCPRFCVSRGVINDDANVHVPKIAALEAQQKELVAALEDPAIYEVGGKAVSINRDLSNVTADLARLTREWETATATV